MKERKKEKEIMQKGMKEVRKKNKGGQKGKTMIKKVENEKTEKGGQRGKINKRAK